jgi:hypothetical protein
MWRFRNYNAPAAPGPDDHELYSRFCNDHGGRKR